MITYPSALRKYLRDTFDSHLLPSGYPQTYTHRDLASLGFLRSFVSFISGNKGEPHSELARQEVVIFDRKGCRIDSCIPEVSFTTTWCPKANAVSSEGKETLEAVLKGIDVDLVRFVVSIWYSHGIPKSVRVYHIQEE